VKREKRKERTGHVTRRTALETFAGTGATPTDEVRPLGRQPRDRPAVIDIDVPTEHLGVRGGVGRIERASLVITDIAFDAEDGLLARGRLTAGGAGANDATWLCNRPFENHRLSLSEIDADTISLSLAPVDLGDHGVVTLDSVPIPLPERGRTRGRGPVASLLRAVAGLSE